MSRPVSIMDITTRNVKTFPSMAACGKFFDVKQKSIFLRIEQGNITRPYRGHFIKYFDDPTPWPDKAVVKKKSTLRKAVILIHIKTGKIEKFPSIQQAAKKINCHVQSLREKLKQKVPSPYREYLIEYVHDNLSIT